MMRAARPSRGRALLAVALVVASGAGLAFHSAGAAPAPPAGLDPDLAPPAVRVLAARLGGEPWAAAAGEALSFGEASLAASPAELLDLLPPLLEAHGRAVRSLVPGADLPGVQGLDDARRVVGALASRPDPRLDPRGAVLWALRLPTPAPAPELAPPMPHHASLAEALAELHARRGTHPEPAQAEAYARLGDIRPELAEALTRVVDAYLLSDAAARQAFSSPPPGRAFDAPLLAAARYVVADAVLAQRPLLQPDPRGPAIVECGILILDVLGGPSEYPQGCDAPLIIELGGDDIYHINAGGNIQPGEAALLVDAGGRDNYSCQKVVPSALNGAAFGGVGNFFDFEGDDDYAPTVFAEGALDGGAVNGTSLFVDLRGNDTRGPEIFGPGATHGGSTRQGDAAFIDLDGTDYYYPALHGDGATTGGSIGGAGLMVSMDGPDQAYVATVSGRGAVHGAGVDGGRGLLLALGGSGAYHAIVSGDGAANGAGLGGAGLVVDLGGDTTYQSFIAGPRALHGAAVNGTGILLDLGGSNFFIGPTGPGGVSSGAARGAGALGLLLSGGEDAAGSDFYDAGPDAAAAQGAGAMYGAGIVVDRGGVDSMSASAGFAQGAGAHGGLGVLVRNASGLANGVLALVGSASGQGLGAQGAGVLLQPAGAGRTNYVDYALAYPHRARGGGAAVFVDMGTALAGVDPTCSGGVEVAHLALPPTQPAAEAWLCAPAEASVEPVYDPGTWAPVGSLWKPGVPCEGEDLVVGECGEVVASLLGPDAPGWLGSDELTTTTSGGLELYRFDHPDLGGEAHWLLRHEAASADRICDINCSVYHPR